MESEIPLHAWLPCMTGASQGAFVVTPEISHGDISYIRTKVRVTKSEISMHTWRSPMSAASQGAFVDIPEILHSDISRIIKKRCKRHLQSFTACVCVVAGAGFEPTTSGLWARRATNCSTPRHLYYIMQFPVNYDQNLPFVKKILVPETGVEPVRSVRIAGF